MRESRLRRRGEEGVTVDPFSEWDGLMLLWRVNLMSFRVISMSFESQSVVQSLTELILSCFEWVNSSSRKCVCFTLCLCLCFFFWDILCSCLCPVVCVPLLVSVSAFLPFLPYLLPVVSLFMTLTLCLILTSCLPVTVIASPCVCVYVSLSLFCLLFQYHVGSL